MNKNRIIKHLPVNFGNYLNGCVLAYWFMDNGSKHDNSGYILAKFYEVFMNKISHFSFHSCQNHVE